MSDRVSTKTAQSRLLFLWCIPSGLMFAVLFIQGLMQKYGDQSAAAWAWFTPLVLPALGMVVGAWVQTANESRESATVSRSAFRGCALASALHLFLLALVIFLEPLAPVSPLRFFQFAQQGLAFTQAVAGAMLGVLFVSQR